MQYQDAVLPGLRYCLWGAKLGVAAKLITGRLMLSILEAMDLGNKLNLFGN
jgi:hypothetical protein